MEVMSTPETTGAHAEMDGVILVRADDAEVLVPDPGRVIQGLAHALHDLPIYEGDNENVVGQSLRARRRFLGLRQADIASQMRVSRGLVSQWEQGTTRIMAKDLVRLAETLGVTVNDLLSVHPAYPNLSWLPRYPQAAANAEERAEVLRLEHQERMLLSVFHAMTDEQRERVLRVVHALRE